jgi:hypothetical protein
MIIYTKAGKSKKKKPNAKERKLIAEWDTIVSKYKPKSTAKDNTSKSLSLNYNYRKTNIPSVDTGYYNTFRKPDKFYTGDKLIGIGTLHKSNAVPIFSEEEARDQASMRR